MGARHPTRSSQDGYTLIEILTVLMISAVLASIAVGNLKELNDPLQNGAAQLSGFLKQVRVKAISQTLAYHVSAESSTTIVTSYGYNCAAAPTPDPLLRLTLPSGTSLTSTSFNFCFTSRGLSDQNVTIGIRDGDGTKNIEVLLGGGVRIQ